MVCNLQVLIDEFQILEWKYGIAFYYYYNPLKLTSKTANFHFYASVCVHIQQTEYNILIQRCYYICNAYTRARLAISLYFEEKVVICLE